MRRFAIPGAILLAAASLRPAAASEPLDAGQVRTLIQQLDDPRFPARREAERLLRQQGVEAVPLLRQALQARPPLEVTRRLDSLVDEAMRLPWHDDLGAALREAGKSRKPMLVVSSLGGRDANASLATVALLRRTFDDPALVGFLQKNFVLYWQNQMPDVLPDALDGMGLPFFAVPEAPEPYAADQVEKLRSGMGGRNVRSIFCTPDGKVASYLEGFWEARQYREEAAFALGLSDSITPSPEAKQPELARLLLGERAQRPVTAPVPNRGIRPRIDFSKKPTLDDLLGERIESFLDVLKYHYLTC